VETTTEEEELEAPALSDEDKDEIITKLRRENAGKRVANKGLEKELNEFREWKANQLTDLEKANLRIQELEDEKNANESAAAELEYSKLQRKVAKAVSLSLNLADRIRGDSEAEMLEDAKSLLKDAGKGSNSLTGRPTTGGPVTPDEDQKDWLRGALSKYSA
jgi:hypothetical protein